MDCLGLQMDCPRLKKNRCKQDKKGAKIVSNRYFFKFEKNGKKRKKKIGK